MKFFAHICIYTSLTLLSVFDLEAQSSTVADDRLLEAIDHYTGVIGTVNDTRAKELLLEVSQNEDDALAQMWIARVLSTGRMGFQQNLSKAKQMAEGILTEIGALADSHGNCPRRRPWNRNRLQTSPSLVQSSCQRGSYPCNT